jgi:hypothetical protein
MLIFKQITLKNIIMRSLLWLIANLYRCMAFRNWDCPNQTGHLIHILLVIAIVVIFYNIITENRWNN